MGTRAIVLDERVKGKGFYIQTDGKPAFLGRQLSLIYTNRKWLSLEEILNQLIEYRIQSTKKLISDLNIDYVNINNVEHSIRNSVFILSSEQAEIAKIGGLISAREVIEINLEYIYSITNNGIYVTGVEIPKKRRI